MCVSNFKCFRIWSLDVLYRVYSLTTPRNPVILHIMDNLQFAPQTESYMPVPDFKYSPRQREVDFAQLIAAGGDRVGSLIKAAIIPLSESNKLSQPELYALACNLLRSEAVQERVDHFSILHKASMTTSAERIKQELAAIAFVDPSLVQEDHTTRDPDTDVETTSTREVRDLRTLPRYVRAAIKEFYVDRDGIPRYKFHDKLKSIQMIADLEGLFNDANAAKAPQVTFNLGGSTTELKQAANLAPIIDHPPQQAVPEFMR